MNDTSRAILISWTAAKITFVLTVVIAVVTAYVRLHGDVDPSWFDTLAWVFVFGGLILVPALFVPAIIVGLFVGVFCKIRLSRIRRIRLNSEED
jgi:RsiW-degrading membrane proteinase PrsW (M82 family)